MDLLSRNVHGNVPAPKWYHHNLRLTDGLTISDNWLEIVAILVHYQPSYNTSHKTKPSDPLLCANGTVRWGMYISHRQSCHLWTPSHPQVPPVQWDRTQYTQYVHCFTVQ